MEAEEDTGGWLGVIFDPPIFELLLLESLDFFFLLTKFGIRALKPL